jgi:amino acid adenylation domain-containing protein
LLRLAGAFSVTINGDVITASFDCLRPMTCESNKLKTTPVTAKCIHQLFEEQVECAPDAIALVFEEQQLTYRELNSRANQLANHLRHCGLGPETVVGICLERSVEMIVSLLGILKAGGAYLPLDPAYPTERLSVMLKDAGAKLLIAQQRLREQLSGCDVALLAIDSEWDNIAHASIADQPREVTPENLAYVMYTSGSTGKPKSVGVAHRSVVRLVKETSYAHFGGDEVFLQFASLSFDASTFEIWGSLLNGGRLVVMPAGSVSLAELGAVVQRERVTTLWLTAGLFHQMVDSELESLRGLRQLLAGGDVLSVTHVERAARELRNCQLINGYGPTENTTFTCCYPVQAGERFESSVPIGFPIARTEVYILDEEMQPVAAGATGELYIAGDGLARGYLNDPALTAERFVPNAFAAGERLYRTGDSVRRLSDDSIEFLGRLDQQAKVRGYRIEMGEIEAALAQHASVIECVVVARDEAPGGKRLIAYVVPDANAPNTRFDSSHVRQWQKLYDETYDEANVVEPAFNITGWNSSYTGEPIPAEEMREWVDNTVDRILSLRPQRVLEIGCGTGLLLFKIAPHCLAYQGTDFSKPVIDQLRTQVEKFGELDHVALSYREADDFSKMQPDSFDLVILNSVVQYFPNIDYLIRVLQGAVKVTKPGGTIFVGDVRNLDLLTTFHASVELHKAPASLRVAELAERVRKAVAEEDELIIAPSFFQDVTTQLEKSCSASVLPKLGDYHNEMTKFRYDVVLRVSPAKIDGAGIEWRDWAAGELTLESLGRLLQNGAMKVIALSGVPNKRSGKDARIVDLLNDQSCQTVAEFRALLDSEHHAGIDPGELEAVGHAYSYSSHFSWADSASDGRYDVVFKRDESASANGFVPQRWSKQSRKSWSEYANQPSLKTSVASLIPELRSFLQTKLPAYMIPAAFVVLDRLPLTANGKVDRRALPAPERQRPALAEDYIAPRNRMEQELAEIWTEVLGIESVGVNDNFFELGGHSLLATQVVSRIRDVFRIELSLQSFFADPTIAACTARIVNRDVAEASMAVKQQMTPRTAPLSFGQQRLWFVDQLQPGTTIYNVPAKIPLVPQVDLAILERSLNEIMRRHEALRTTFTIVDDQPVQVRHTEMKVDLPVIDLRRLTSEARHETLQRLINREAHEPFDLSRGPLLRTTVLQLSDDKRILLLTMHHIIADGWSWRVLFDELREVYRAFAAGRPSPLPELPIQYSDFASWQRKFVSGAVFEKQLSYWKQQLAGAPTVLELPIDAPRPRAQSFGGALETLLLPEGLATKLRELTRRERATLFMTMLAGFNVLLHRYTGREDILVGAPIANRTRIEFEGLIGFFLNNLVLRTRLSAHASFREVLQTVRRAALEAYANQDVPFERIVEELNPQRDLSRTPVFQIFFNLLNFADRIELPEIATEALAPMEAWSQPQNPSSQFDLTMYVGDRGQAIELALLYNTDIFSRARVRVMLRQFSYLLEQVAAAPDAPISAHSLVEPRSHAVLPDPSVALNEPRMEPITDTIRQIAKELPDRPSICQGPRSWTYRELENRAESIARALLKDDLAQGDVVAVTGPMCFELIAGLLGVLKGGGVLLTLDRNVPIERQRLMLCAAGCKHVLCVGPWREEDEWLREFQVLQIVEDEGSSGSAALQCGEVQPHPKPLDFPRRSAANPHQAITTYQSTALPDIKGDEPAYLFFTSGTTGVPKGVLGTHKGLSHFLKWQRETFHVGPEDRCAQLTAPSFDVVLRDIFLPLTSGASLHLSGNPDEVASGRIINWLEREQISIIHTVPSLAQAWLSDVPNDAVLATLRCVFFAGEPLTDALVRAWRKHFHAGQLINLYGPTETTLAKCCYVVPDEPAPGVQPVGQPLPETQALVLNANSGLCGVGEPSEIVIRTPFRTRGYINANEEQQSRFIKNPFRDDENDFLYRTGDRGRYRPDGLLEILGRLDDQIKIRGVRVEPDEVNATIARHPAVAASVVVATKDEHDENALAAYVVLRRGPNANSDLESASDLRFEISDLRTYLERQLPSAMVPSYFISLKELPLTPNGKLDRRALPEPDRSRNDLAKQYVAPRDPTEEIIAGIWSKALGIERVGVFDNFFELGGHSLKATKVAALVAAAFQIDLPLRTLFETATVAGLAAAVENILLNEIEMMSDAEARQFA